MTGQLLTVERGQVRTWPLALLLAGYPLLWLSGIAFLALPALALPMAWELYRRGRVRIPAGFGFWLLLLLIVLFSGTMLAEHAPGTVGKDAGLGRYLAFSLRLANYASAGVIVLYVGNLTERELPTTRVVRWLSVFFLVVVGCGLVGLLLPPVKLATPAQYLLPGGLLRNGYVRSLVTVTFAQWHSIVGEETSPRPAAPFLYTNQWGNVLSLLLPWFVLDAIGWARTKVRRFAAAGVLAVMLVPVVYSLNRGLWLGLLVLIGYLVITLLLRGKLLPAAAMLTVIAGLGLTLAFSPLATVVADRLDNPHSNDRRGSTAMAAVDAARSSPFIGYGGQLSLAGSNRSIAVGPTPDCPNCGTREVGGEGQLFQLLVTTGFAGAACYVLFFVRVWWRYRQDDSPVGTAGGATVALIIFYLPIYGAIGMPLAIAMVGVGLWWRSAVATGTGRSGPVQLAQTRR